MKRIFYILATLLCLPLASLAGNATDDGISATVTEMQPGLSWQVTVHLNSTASSNYTAFQLDVALPDGVGYMAGSATAGWLLPSHAVAASELSDGTLRIAAYSGSNTAIGTGTDDLFSFMLTAENELPAGSYDLAFTNILFSTRTGTELAFAGTTAQLVSTFSATGTPTTHHIIYMVDDEVYQDMVLTAGTTVTPPADPEKEGHTFEGWDGLPTTMPAKDVTVTARFSVNSYTVTYYLDNEIYTTQTVAYGSAITPPEVTVAEGREFGGWESVPTTMPAKDICIYGATKTTGLAQLSTNCLVDVYDLRGFLVRRNVKVSRLRQEFPAGLYIVGGRTILIR